MVSVNHSINLWGISNSSFSVCLSSCLSIFHFTYLCIFYLQMFSSVYICLPSYLSVSLISQPISAWPSTYMSIFLFIMLLICSSIYPSSCISQVIGVERAIQQNVLAKEWVEPDLQFLHDLSPAPNPRHTSAFAAATRILRPKKGESLDQTLHEGRIIREVETGI